MKKARDSFARKLLPPRSDTSETWATGTIWCHHLEWLHQPLDQPVHYFDSWHTSISGSVVVFEAFSLVP